VLTATLQPSRLNTWTGLIPPKEQRLNVQLGWSGRCPKEPDLTIVLFDDSGSVSAPGGGDPIGNRYAEASLAFWKLNNCDCGTCLAAIRHFDTPTGDVGPGPLGRRWFQSFLKGGLQHPEGAAGISLLGPSLEAAEEIASNHPNHTPHLVVFSDWDLFDPPGYLERLEAFPGEVFAVGLGTAPPKALESDHVRVLTVQSTDPPGVVARALFGALVSSRPGAEPR